MHSGFSNKPKILRGAFVEFRPVEPLIVGFQFNPEQLTRSRSLSFSVPNRSDARSLRDFHKCQTDLGYIQRHQQVDIAEETIGFDIRLDATDKLDRGDPIAEQHGIAPQLATLELMMQPRGETHFGSTLDAVLGSIKAFSHARSENPPMILFIWGRKRILPVNLNSMSIAESEFSTELDPIRATVAVELTVIEGKNPPFIYSKLITEKRSQASRAERASVMDIANLVIPG